MNIRSSSLSVLMMLSSLVCNAQDPGSRILMTIDGKNTEAGEFIRMYAKSLDTEKNLTIDQYIPQFVLFKLKVADAIHLGYDSTESFRKELEGYRNQVAQSYLTDNSTKEKLLKQAYQRSLKEINAWHILIGMNPDPSPDDTLKAWKKAIDVRTRILNGEPFEDVARSTSDDKSVLTNGGNLGYFTVFQMITPFENAAYSMKKGEISEPVRSPYGYHIIKVTDIRASRGKVRVAHIMKNAPPGADDATVKKAENEINEIYALLNSGASFSELAASKSDHRQSAEKGGQMDWFGTGEIISEFSEAAFAIRDTGKYSKPVRSPYGFHIIKLLEKRPPPSYEEARPLLESRLNQTYLNSISRKTFIDKLRKDYNYTVNRQSFDWFVNNTDTLIIQGLKKYDKTSLPAGNIYSFANQKLTNQEFADYIEKRGFIIDTKDSLFFITTSLEIRSSDHIFDYENSRLEMKNPEFRYLMNEFHDGILMFEISADKIWNPVSEDTSGLKKYYEDHKNEHLTQPGISAKIYTLRSTGNQDLLSTYFKKYSGKKDPDSMLRKKFNRKNDSALVINEGTWMKGQDGTIDALRWVKGEQSFAYMGNPSIIVIKELIDPVPLEFNDVQEEMIKGFQESLEKAWAEQLNKKYTVKIDNVVLSEIRRKFGQ
ncbi:MAG TPA: peptidylprolyl isomerase [Bacteroidales bacterium]|nr:peptidylprolyl isomerase [Bacteroidales bacterium]